MALLMIVVSTTVYIVHDDVISAMADLTDRIGFSIWAPGTYYGMFYDKTPGQ
jgi:hypothetical protein